MAPFVPWRFLVPMSGLLKLDLEEPALPRGNAGYRLEVGRVLRRSFGATLANLPSFLAMALLLTAPGTALEVAFNQLGYMAHFPVPLLVGAVKGLFGFVLTGALTFAVLGHLRGRRVPFGEMVRAGWGSVVRVFVVSLFVGLAAFLGLLFLVVPGIVVLCMNWVAVPVAVVEETGYRQSLDRSQDLTSGTRWPVFAVLLVLWAVHWAVLGGLLAVSAGAAAVFTLDWFPVALVPVVVAVVELPLQCLNAVAAAVGYHDLRVNREGAEVEDLIRVFE